MSRAPQIEITGVLVREFRPPNCENFVIGEINLIVDGEIQRGATIKVVGNAEPDELKLHLAYRWYGSWHDDPKFGRQFKFVTFTLAKPHGQTGVVKYLQECPHIGEATARQLWNLFGPDAVRVCRESPELVSEKVTRLKIEQAREIAAKLADLSALEDTSIELIDLLSGRGFPKATAREAVKRWGNRAPWVIQHDPFRLMAFRACGFLRCDSMWMDLGLPPAKMKRQICCAWYSIASDTEGHTWHPDSKAAEYLSAKIAGVQLDLNKAIGVAVRAKALAVKHWCEKCGATGRLMVPDLFDGTTMVAKRCPECAGEPNLGRRWIADYRKASAEDFVARHLALAELESDPAFLSLFETHVERVEVIPNFTRCTRCHRKLTADTVAILNGDPYGPDCITKIPGGEAAEQLPLAEWLGRHPVVQEKRTNRFAGTKRVEFANQWPAVSEIDGVTDHQREHLERATLGRIGLLLGAPGTGKAQPIDAKVLTPSGWRKIGSIRVNDWVYGPNGQPRLVLGVFPQGVKPIFRVEMSDGSSTECTDDHLWQTQCVYERKKDNASLGRSTGRVRPLSEIRATISHGKRKRPNHRIPMTAPVDFPASNLPLHPYILGVLIGDGSTGGASIKLTSIDEEVVEAVRELLPAGFGVLRQGKSKKDWRIAKTTPRNSYIKNPVLNAIRTIGLYGKRAWDKFIPEQYKFSSIEQRIALLQGLLDTDGYCAFHKTWKASAIEFTTTSERLAADVVHLVESLGGQARTRTKIPTYTHKGEKKSGRLAYTLAIRLPDGINPFRLSRKLSQYHPPRKNVAGRIIAGVVPAGEKECVCISVDASDGLYLTDRFIVTHNTYCAAALMKSLSKRFGPADIAVCAPTGKASHRCTESMRAYSLNLKACTIHSLLGVESSEDGNWSFKHKESNPLPYKFILVDESSMIDTSLLRSLLAARARGTHVLFIGDPNQLPPVGHGAPLRDMIAAKLPYGELREIKRNAGTVVRACAAIRDGLQFPTDAKIELDVPCRNCNGTGGVDSGGSREDGSFIDVPCEFCDGAGKLPPKNLVLITAGKSQAVAAIEKQITDLRDAGIDAIWACQVIVAVNKRSALARVTLNKRLQDLLNPGGRSVVGSPFRVNDKVICLKNSFFKLCDPLSMMGNEKGQVAVANGEFGKVLDVEPKKTVVEFFNPSRKVEIFRAAAPAKKSDDKDDDKADDSASGTGCDLDLGYACTAHKMQGSDADHVVIALDEYPGASGKFGICKREWLFTAISRAKLACYLVGLRSTARTICEQTALDKRKTFLRELIEHYRVELRKMPAPKGEPSCQPTLDYASEPTRPTTTAESSLVEKLLTEPTFSA